MKNHKIPSKLISIRFWHWQILRSSYRSIKESHSINYLVLAKILSRCSHPAKLTLILLNPKHKVLFMPKECLRSQICLFEQAHGRYKRLNAGLKLVNTS